jgi:hypothetical protein
MMALISSAATRPLLMACGACLRVQVANLPETMIKCAGDYPFDDRVAAVVALGLDELEGSQPTSSHLHRQAAPFPRWAA